jgi:radical SAM protein with 4Fe4S-binding SPASM domain
MDKKELLTKNKAFCILPWIHMHVWPNGNAMPCCIADSNKPFGNVKNKSIEEVWNSDEYKDLRLAMLNGEKRDVCNRCYELEDSTYTWTLRKNHNQWFGDKHFDLVENTNADGSMDEFRMAYLDIRFSNICNMKCRSCGPELSSQHAKEFKDLYGERELSKMLKNDGKIVVNIAKENNFWDDLQQYLPDVEEVYWAGGEALITDEHYKILDYWIANNKTDVRLRYTTNFSNFKYKQKSLFDYWKEFDDIQVSGSLDCNGARAEYSRHGTDWAQIERNRMEMLEKVPHVHFELTPTISLYNVWNWPDFHMDWVERGLVDIENCRLNILTDPKFMRIDNIPEDVKIELRSKYIDYKAWAFDKIKQRAWERQEVVKDVIGKIDSVIQFLNRGTLDEEKLQEFFNNNHKLDAYRKEDFWAVYPEMDWLRKYV